MVTSMAKISSKHTFILPEEKIENLSNIFPNWSVSQYILFPIYLLRYWQGEFFLAIKIFFSSGSLPLFSWPWCVRGRGYYREKLDADHSYSLIVIITVMMLIIIVTIIALIYYCIRRLNGYYLCCFFLSVRVWAPSWTEWPLASTSCEGFKSLKMCHNPLFITTLSGG